MYTPTKYNPDILHRRSIRLYGYDYSCDGLYFVTVCCRNKACSFGEIVDGEMMLNAAGRMVEKCWLAIPTRYRNVILHEYVVMPNHFHAILQIDTVGQMIGAFKSITANEYICGVEKIRLDTVRPKIVATQLLRTHHPQRQIVRQHCGIHYYEPCPLAER